MNSDKPEIGWRKDLLSETEKKKKRSSSSCSSSSSSSSPSSESDRKKRKKEKKERKEKRREERRLKKQQRAIEKAQKKEFKKALKRKRKEEKHNNSVSDPGPTSIKSSDDEGPDCSVPIDLMYTKSHAPQTKIEYDKKQSHIRRVVDPETGRSRLIKGDGEILEEIVSKDRHREINKQATKEDGEYFQAKTTAWNPPK